MFVEKLLSAPKVIPNGRFEGDGIVVEANLDDRIAVAQLRQAFAKEIPRKLLRAYRRHERSGWVYVVLGGAVLLSAAGYYEFKERKGEDVLSFLKKLNQAKRENQGK